MKGLILGVYTQPSEECNKIVSYTSCFKDVNEKYNGQLVKILEVTGPFYKPAKQRIFWLSVLEKPSSELGFDCLSVIDLGCDDAKDNPLEELNQKSENVRSAIAGGIKALQASSQFEDIYLDDCGNALNVAEAAYLINYTFDKMMTKTKPRPWLHLYKSINVQNNTIEDFERGKIFAESQNFARWLTETPANHMTPSIFASAVTEKFKNFDVNVIVRDKNWIESMKMGSFLSVTRGSEEPPKFVELHYNGLPDSEKHIAFVGKGITFDSGGISLKPSEGMDKLRADMGGAACVVSSIFGAASLNLKINVKGFIPLSENLPSGRAVKPGDVVFAMNGKSIQVDNTDAEGRLVLADALCYAQQFNPVTVVDVATLTGAATVALGTGACAVYSNDKELWKLLKHASYTTGDRVWKMPLFQHYSKEITTCTLADINNADPSGKAGSCTAAAFLKEFINSDVKWMHVDMSCVKENKDEIPYLSKGMSGRPTRTFIQFLQLLAERLAERN